jgi:glucans biosynthesis protein C
LLIFCTIYAAIRAMFAKPPDGRPWSPSNRHIFSFTLALAAATFGVRTIQPIGTAIWNMQLCYFAQYTLLFVAGIHARRHGWLIELPSRTARRWLALALTAGTVWFAALVFAAMKFHWGNTVLGGVHWQSAILCGWEALFCVGVCLGLVALFRDRLNRQPALVRFLSRNAFAVYVFHPPVVIGAALALRRFAALPVEKFAIVSAIGIVVSFAVAAALRRIPLLGRVL